MIADIDVSDLTSCCESDSGLIYSYEHSLLAGIVLGVWR
jgi:hypothetical protein